MMNQKIWAQSVAIDDPAERMAIAIRQFLHQSIQDSTWGWVIVRIGLVAAPLSETIERGVMTDLEAGIRLNRFQVDSLLIKGISYFYTFKNREYAEIML